jgi:hypothetical protein
MSSASPLTLDHRWAEMSLPTSVALVEAELASSSELLRLVAVLDGIVRLPDTFDVLVGVGA